MLSLQFSLAVVCLNFQVFGSLTQTLCDCFCVCAVCVQLGVGIFLQTSSNASSRSTRKLCWNEVLATTHATNGIKTADRASTELATMVTMDRDVDMDTLCPRINNTDSAQPTLNIEQCTRNSAQRSLTSSHGTSNNHPTPHNQAKNNELEE